MALPFVAGAVALMLAADESLTTEKVRKILTDTAQERGTTGMDNVLGHGLVDVEAAVRKAAGAGDGNVDFPHHVFQQGTVPDNTAVRIPIGVVDMNKPLAITVSIDGKLTRWGWSPDLDIILLDRNGEPFTIPNPLYPWLSNEPTLPVSGTTSTCPAGEDCGRMGTQETIHVLPNALQLGVPDFFVEIYPFADRPNKGKGGNFTIGLSNGYFSGPVDGPPDYELVADAGSDMTVTDDDGDGSAEVVLDGRASRGLVTNYVWTDLANAIDGQGAVVKLTLPVGTNTLSLSVDDGSGFPDIDNVTVTVSAPSTDSGGRVAANPAIRKRRPVNDGC